VCDLTAVPTGVNADAQMQGLVGNLLEPEFGDSVEKMERHVADLGGVLTVSFR